MTIYNASTHQAVFATSATASERIPSTDKGWIDLAAMGLVDLAVTANAAAAPVDKNKIWLEASATAGSPGVAKYWNETTQLWATVTKEAMFRHMGGQTDDKLSVRVGSTANLTLTGPGATIDGVTMAVGDRFLAKNQTTASQNGLYVWTGAATAAVRTLDADGANELTPGVIIYVEEGATTGAKTWKLDNIGAITIGTTALTFSQWAPTVTTVPQGSIA
jgi:hypothetical protein